MVPSLSTSSLANVRSYKPGPYQETLPSLDLSVGSVADCSVGWAVGWAVGFDGGVVVPCSVAQLTRPSIKTVETSVLSLGWSPIDERQPMEALAKLEGSVDVAGIARTEPS